jgi:hypothetical protein
MPIKTHFSGSPKWVESDQKLRQCLAEAMHSSPKNREQIAEELSARVGRRVTVHMLDDFSAPSKDNRFPAAWVPAFCEITSDDAAQRFLMGPNLRTLVELGEHEISAKRATKSKAELLGRLLNDNENGRK